MEEYNMEDYEGYGKMFIAQAKEDRTIHFEGNEDWLSADVRIWRNYFYLAVEGPDEKYSMLLDPAGELIMETDVFHELFEEAPAVPDPESYEHFTTIMAVPGKYLNNPELVIDRFRTDLFNLPIVTRNNPVPQFDEIEFGREYLCIQVEGEREFEFNGKGVDLSFLWEMNQVYKLEDLPDGFDLFNIHYTLHAPRDILNSHTLDYRFLPNLARDQRWKADLSPWCERVKHVAFWNPVTGEIFPDRIPQGYDFERYPIYALKLKEK